MGTCIWTNYLSWNVVCLSFPFSYSSLSSLSFSRFFLFSPLLNHIYYGDMLLDKLFVMLFVFLSFFFLSFFLSFFIPFLSLYFFSFSRLNHIYVDMHLDEFFVVECCCVFFLLNLLNFSLLNLQKNTEDLQLKKCHK